MCFRVWLEYPSSHVNLQTRKTATCTYILPFYMAILVYKKLLWDKFPPPSILFGLNTKATFFKKRYNNVGIFIEILIKFPHISFSLPFQVIWTYLLNKTIVNAKLKWIRKCWWKSAAALLYTKEEHIFVNSCKIMLSSFAIEAFWICT